MRTLFYLYARLNMALFWPVVAVVLLYGGAIYADMLILPAERLNQATSWLGQGLHAEYMLLGVSVWALLTVAVFTQAQYLARSTQKKVSSGVAFLAVVMALGVQATALYLLLPWVEYTHSYAESVRYLTEIALVFTGVYTLVAGFLLGKFFYALMRGSLRQEKLPALRAKALQQLKKHGYAVEDARVYVQTLPYKTVVKLMDDCQQIDSHAEASNAAFGRVQSIMRDGGMTPVHGAAFTMPSRQKSGS